MDMENKTTSDEQQDTKMRHNGNNESIHGEVGIGIIEEFGYQPAYRRVFEGVGSFAIVLAVASPMMAITIISSYQITYGGYWGLTWGWFIPAILFFAQPIAVAELCSSMPVNGANYWWTAALAPPAWSRPLSFLLGWLTVTQAFTALASISFAGATSFARAISMFHPEWVATDAQIMGIAMAIVLLWGALSFLQMERIAMVFIANCAIVLITTFIYIIGLPAAHAARDRPFAPAADVFGDYTNYSDWNRPVAVPMTFFSVAWAVTGWNSPSYVAEETKNARVVCPRSILQTYAAMAILGFLMCVLSAFCIVDMDAAASDPTGLPLYTLIFDTWGPRTGAIFFVIASGNALVGGSSFMLTSASQIAAFARDGGLPFSSKLAHVNKRTNMPIYSQALLAVGALLVLLFGLSALASGIIFSLAVIAVFLMMVPPMLLRVFAGDRFVPGPFYTGVFSKPIHLFAACTLIYMMILECFPPVRHWDVTMFNYNWVVAVGALVASAIGWFTLGHNYRGLDVAAVEAWRDHSQGPTSDQADRDQTEDKDGR
ncbi:hypothetical protein S40288_06692 [Stachybotrys chartarum IBT 40288]|nr:hypothetical protein S40288_06692 [Stachybotrys chartarum IBT 40288]